MAFSESSLDPKGLNSKILPGKVATNLMPIALVGIINLQKKTIFNASLRKQVFYFQESGKDFQKFALSKLKEYSNLTS